MQRAIVIHPRDNVATAIKDIKENTNVSVKIGKKWKEIHVKRQISFGHKFALSRISRGEEVIKYGECIGRASFDIEEGEHVHVHNVESLRGKGDISQ